MRANFVAAVVLLFVWILVDVGYVLAGQPNPALWRHPVAKWTFVALPFLVFVIVNWSLFERTGSVRRVFAALGSASLITFGWYIAGMVIVYLVHSLIGGRD